LERESVGPETLFAPAREAASRISPARFRSRIRTETVLLATKPSGSPRSL
jgi:hypothetical protein